MSIFQMSLYFVLSLSIVLVTMPFLIQYLKKLSFKQTVSEYALEDDRKRQEHLLWVVSCLSSFQLY